MKNWQFLFLSILLLECLIPNNSFSQCNSYENSFETLIFIPGGGGPGGTGGTLGIMIVDEGNTENLQFAASSTDVILTLEDCQATLNLKLKLANLVPDPEDNNQFVFPNDENGNPTPPLTIRVIINEQVTLIDLEDYDYATCDDEENIFYWTGSILYGLENICLQPNAALTISITFLDDENDQLYNIAEQSSAGEIFDCNYFIETGFLCTEAPEVYAVMNMDRTFTNSVHPDYCSPCEGAGGGIHDPRNSTSELIKDNNLEQKLYPSPFRDDLEIFVRGLKESAFEVNILDVNGRSVFHKNAFINNNGSYRLNVNTASWPSGIYFSHLRQNDQKIITKVIKVN